MKYNLRRTHLCFGFVMILILSACSREAQIEKWKTDLASGNRDVKLTAVSYLSEYRIVEPILSALKDRYWEVRVAAARELKNLRDSRAALPLIEALADESYAVREEAAWAMTVFKDERSIPSLVRLLRDNNGSVSMWAAEALKSIGAPSLDALIKALGEFDEQDAERVASILIGLGSASVEKLAAAIPAVDGAARERLVDTLSRTLVVLRSPSTSMDLLVHSDPSVRRAAAVSLGEIRDPSSSGSLIAALADAQPLVRMAVVKSLAKIGDARSLPDLLRALQSDADQRVRVEIASRLASFKDPSAVDPLIRALNDPSLAVRSKAAESLGTIGDPRAVGPLVERIKKADSLAVESLSALVKIGAASCGPLFEVLKGPYPAVRRGVARALSQIGCPEFSAFVNKAAAAKQLRALADLYPYMLGVHRDESVPLLLEVFRRYADGEMATDFLNSGSDALYEAAKKWSEARGYEIWLIKR